MQKIYTLLSAVFFLMLINTISAQVSALSEGFETVLPTNWVATNKSNPANAAVSWTQGNPANFNAYNGNSNSYAAANFECIADPPGFGTISCWLMTPVLTLTNGATLKFYTRKGLPNPFDFPDRLEIRLSKNGSSTNVGTDALSVGDFTSFLASVNQSLVEGGYPTEWREYTLVLSGITSGQTGRIGFRYFVTDAGINGSNSDYIGLDNVTYDIPFPVKLIDFSASLQNYKPILQWTVTNEQEMLGYDIEKSVDGTSFSKVGFVAAQNTGSLTKYSFSDGTALQGKAYYRLKQKDKDGTVTYSEIRTLEAIALNAWKLINNTPGAQVKLQLDLTGQAPVTVQLFSALGTEVFRQYYGNLPAGTTTVELASQFTGSGIYYLKVTMGNESRSEKILR